MSAKYITIANELTKRLLTLQKSGIRRLPGETTLAEEYRCSRQTIRAALAILLERGLIEKRQGSGTYISDGAHSKTREITVLLPDKSEYIYPAILGEIRGTLSAKGYTVRCLSTNGLAINERHILLSLIEQQPAGIIIEPINNVTNDVNAGLLKRLQEAGVPLVYLNCAYPQPAAPCIRAGSFEGAQSLVRYLHSLGHTDIAGLFRCDDSRGPELCHGYMQACIDLNIDFQENSICWFSSGERRRLVEGSTSLPETFLNEYLNQCTAVICQTDEVAYHLIAYLNSRGISVPERVSVVGFGDSNYATAGSVGITTLGFDSVTPGRAAAEAMLSLLIGKKPLTSTLHLKLHERASCRYR